MGDVQSAFHTSRGAYAAGARPAELYLAPNALRERLNDRERIEVCGAQHPRHGEAQALGVHPAPDLPIAAAAGPLGLVRTSLFENGALELVYRMAGR